MLLFYAIIAVMIILVIAYIISPLLSPKPMDIGDAHILITGGSSGIGKGIAIEAAKKGANVTILARNQNRLTEAKREIEKSCKGNKPQKVVCISVDLSKDYGAVEKAIHQAEELLGPVTILVNCAGTSVSAKFEDIPLEKFQGLMNTNYIGSVYATRAVIKGMKERETGRIVFVSSQAGQLGLFGFSAYSASKYALRGLAEALQMEVKAYNIYVTIAFPPDTDTPGFEEEQKSKPKETRLISETSGLFQSEYVAKVILRDTLRGKFLSYMGLDGYMLSSLTCGMSPATAVWDAAQQVLTMSLFRAISFFYLASFDAIVKKCKGESEAARKQKSQ